MAKPPSTASTPPTASDQVARRERGNRSSSNEFGMGITFTLVMVVTGMLSWLLYMFVLTWQLPWAVLTAGNNKWGTR